MTTIPTKGEPVADLIESRSIGFSAAKRVLDAAVQEATNMKIPFAIAVADRAGHLMLFGRMDGAPLLSSGIAQDKAYTVAAFGGLPTHAWFDVIKDDPPLLHGIVKTDRLIVFGGGVPLKVDGELVGTIGVSGGSAEEDRQVAEAGAGAL